MGLDGCFSMPTLPFLDVTQNSSGLDVLIVVNSLP